MSAKEPSIVRFAVPIPPSVNHAYLNTRTGGRVLTSASKTWMVQAVMLAKNAQRKYGWRFKDSGKLVMELWAYWPDNRRRDIHNLHKLIADAFEGVLYQDDKRLLMRDMDFAVDRKNPRVEIEIREHGGESD